MPTMEPPSTPAAERRAYLRYARRLETLWNYLGLGLQDLTSAVVLDLSRTGVGLILDRPFHPRDTLVVRIPTTTQGWLSHLVRVQHCTCLAEGRYQVGCSFVRPLSQEQLSNHLR